VAVAVAVAVVVIVATVVYRFLRRHSERSEESLYLLLPLPLPLLLPFLLVIPQGSASVFAFAAACSSAIPPSKLSSWRSGSRQRTTQSKDLRLQLPMVFLTFQANHLTINNLQLYPSQNPSKNACQAPNPHNSNKTSKIGIA
jgi:hypothetical protein